MELKGKVALITGGARIGQTIATELAKRGVHLVITYRSSKAASDDTVKMAQSLGVQSLSIHADLSQKVDQDRVLSRVDEAMGGLDILIHLASLYRRTPLESLTDEIWEAQIGSDLYSAYSLGLASAQRMKIRPEGRMIFFSDWVAASGRPRYKEFLPYYISKRGVVGVIEALALELAPKILVNGIAPGPILPPDDLTEEEDAEIRRVTPLGHWGGPMEIAKAVLFLLETDFVTGECLRVDGGRHLY